MVSLHCPFGSCCVPFDDPLCVLYPFDLLLCSVLAYKSFIPVHLSRHAGRRVRVTLRLLWRERTNVGVRVIIRMLSSHSRCLIPCGEVIVDCLACSISAALS